MKNVLIFCGANKGFNDKYAHAASELVKVLVQSGANIITGGGSVGLMGVVADATLACGGKIIGIIPDFLDIEEVGHAGLSEKIVVKSMHERKMLMHERCDAIIALAGGYGTLDELFESLTWAQLEHHGKPIGVLNTDGFYNNMLQFLDHVVAEGLLRQNNRDLLLVAEHPEDLIAQMKVYQPTVEKKWL